MRLSVGGSFATLVASGGFVDVTAGLAVCARGTTSGTNINSERTRNFWIRRRTGVGISEMGPNLFIAKSQKIVARALPQQMFRASVRGLHGAVALQDRDVQAWRHFHSDVQVGMEVLPPDLVIPVVVPWPPHGVVLLLGPWFADEGRRMPGRGERA